MLGANLLVTQAPVCNPSPTTLIGSPEWALVKLHLSLLLGL